MSVIPLPSSESAASLLLPPPFSDFSDLLSDFLSFSCFSVSPSSFFSTFELLSCFSSFSDFSGSLLSALESTLLFSSFSLAFLRASGLTVPPAFSCFLPSGVVERMLPNSSV